MPFTPASSGQPTWGFGTRFAFRFVAAYLVLQWLPLMAIFIPWMVTLGSIRRLPWWNDLNVTVGHWTLVHVAHLPEHWEPRFSANDLALLVGMLVLGVISCGVAVGWSAADRRHTNYDKPFRAVHALVRFGVAALMLVYGWDKILPGQFDFTLDGMALPLAQQHPRELLWAFMGASRVYQVFTGGVECAGGVLLLIGPTVPLGAIVSLAAMTNVLVLDLAYDVGVKFLAAQILLMTMVLVAPFARSMLGAVVQLSQGGASRRIGFGRLAMAALGLWFVIGGYWTAQAQVQINMRRRATPLYGIWDLDAASRNGTPAALLLTDTTLWRRLVVQTDFSAVFVPMTDNASGYPNSGRYQYTFDQNAGTVHFTPFRFSGTDLPLAFFFRRPDRNHLVLTSDDRTLVLTFRRFDPSTYTLVGWEPSWSW